MEYKSEEKNKPVEGFEQLNEQEEEAIKNAFAQKLKTKGMVSGRKFSNQDKWKR